MKTKLAGHLPLQDAIARTIDEAREKMKLAAEEKEEKSEKKDEKVKKLLKFEKKEHGHIPSEKEEKEECAEKTSSVIDPQDSEEVEKLAAALDEMAEKIADYHEMGGESHQGGETLAVQSPTGGTQPYKKDKSKAHNVPTSTGMISTKDNPGAKTAVPTDDHRAPGGNGARYPAKGVLKTGAAALKAEVEKIAFSVTDAGHKLDAKWYGADSKSLHDQRKAGQEYRKKAPVRDTLALSPIKRFGQKMGERHMDYAAKKHEKGGNAYNPFGGILTKSRHEEKEKKSFSLTETGHKYDAAKYKARSESGATRAGAQKQYAKEEPGLAAVHTGLHGLQVASAVAGKGGNIHAASKGSHGKGLFARMADRHNDYAAKKHEKGRNAYNPLGGLLTKSRNEEKGGKSKASAVDYILGKIAAVENGGESRQGGEQLSNTAPIPSNAGRELIRNKDGIKNVTKAQAKSPRKKELAEVLTEPAMSAAHDSKVNENLRNASKGGVKIAAARAFLQKIAEEGCKCEGAGECRHCKMQEKTAALRGNGAETDVSAA
jgi:hypothetical protein